MDAFKKIIKRAINLRTEGQKWNNERYCCDLQEAVEKLDYLYRYSPCDDWDELMEVIRVYHGETAVARAGAVKMKYEDQKDYVNALRESCFGSPHISNDFCPICGCNWFAHDIESCQKENPEKYRE